MAYLSVISTKPYELEKEQLAVACDPSEHITTPKTNYFDTTVLEECARDLHAMRKIDSLNWTVAAVPLQHEKNFSNVLMWRTTDTGQTNLVLNYNSKCQRYSYVNDIKRMLDLARFGSKSLCGLLKLQSSTIISVDNKRMMLSNTFSDLTCITTYNPDTRDLTVSLRCPTDQPNEIYAYDFYTSKSRVVAGKLSVSEITKSPRDADIVDGVILGVVTAQFQEWTHYIKSQFKMRCRTR